MNSRHNRKPDEKNRKNRFTNCAGYDNISAVRGISAVGSAQHWQCWGQEFESPMLHKTLECLQIKRSSAFLCPALNALKMAHCSSNCSRWPSGQCRSCFLPETLGQKGQKGQNTRSPCSATVAGFFCFGTKLGQNWTKKKRRTKMAQRIHSDQVTGASLPCQPVWPCGPSQNHT